MLAVREKTGLSELELITLASIIEGEAIFDIERPIIAAVYLNRIKKRMRLQADPTIQYIIDGPQALGVIKVTGYPSTRTTTNCYYPEL